MARNFVRANSDSLSGAGSIVGTVFPATIACWVKTSNTTDTQGLVSLTNASSSGAYCSLRLSGGKVEHVHNNNTEAILTFATAGSYSSSNWFHAALTSASATSRNVYLDGTGTSNATNRAIAVTLGLSYMGRESAGNYLDGDLAEVGIWNVALTAAEIALLAAGVSPLFVRRASLRGYWPLYGSYSPEISDFFQVKAYTVNGATASAHPRIYKPSSRRYKPPPAYSLPFAAGAYTLSGQAAGLSATRLLTCDAGSCSLSGQVAGLSSARLVTAVSGAYSLSGQAAGLLAARTLTAGAGAYSLSGQDAALYFGRLLSAGAGAYLLTGQDATLKGQNTVAADAGAYSLSGQDAALRATRLLGAGAGAYALSGQGAGLYFSRLLGCGAGAFALTGGEAGLYLGRLLGAGAGSYSLSGQAAGLSKTRMLAALAGGYLLAGRSANFQAPFRPPLRDPYRPEPVGASGTRASRGESSDRRAARGEALDKRAGGGESSDRRVRRPDEGGGLTGRPDEAR